MQASPEPSTRTSYIAILKTAANDFMEDKAMRLGAALAYYTIFSIAPLLVIAIGIAGWFFHDSASKDIQGQVAGLVGEQGGKAVQSMVDAAASKTKGGIVATVVGLVVLLLGATGVFGQLQDSLNTIWKVAPKPGRGVWGFIRDRFLSFAMVGGICFLLLASLVVSAMLAGIDRHLGGAMPGWKVLWSAVNFVVSLGVITLLFAMMYKVLPDVKMSWKDVWMGAFVTAVLFSIGKWGMGMYLGRASVSSAYGAAGSLAVLLLWIYYASQIFLAGAEFTHVYAMQRGSRPVIDSQAVPLTDDMRARQGIPTAETLQESDKAADPRQSSPTAEPEPAGKPGRVLPAAIGFGLGFIFGKRRGRLA